MSAVSVMKWAVLSLGVLVACSGGKGGESVTDGSETTSGASTSATSGGLAGACLEAPEGGPCDAAFERWAFDPATQRCYSWIYGGCEGVVPFEALDACQSTCEPCEAFFGGETPAPSAPAVPIVLENESGAGVWMQAFRGSDPLSFRAQELEIVPAGGVPLVTVTNACDFPCALYDNPECGNSCSGGVGPAIPIYVAPGGRYPMSWSGQHFGRVEVPERCWPKSCVDGLSCGRWLNAAFGEYEARVIVAAEIECVEPGCACSPNAEGWCVLGSEANLVDPAVISAPLSWPGPAVALVVGP